MSEAIQEARFLNQLLQHLGFLEIKGRRLVAQDMETILQRHLGRRKMHMIGCHNRYKVHAFALGQLLFLLDHFLISAIAALGGQEKVPATGLGFPRIG